MLTKSWLPIKRTHCRKGHPLSGDNLIVRQSPSQKYPARLCRACRNARIKAWKAERAYKSDPSKKRAMDKALTALVSFCETVLPEDDERLIAAKAALAMVPRKRKPKLGGASVLRGDTNGR